MGAWGYDVLSNDYVLDYLDEYMDNADFDMGLSYLRRSIPTVAESLLHRRDEYSLLLGVAMVDASVNGVDSSLLGSYPSSPYSKLFQRIENVDLSRYLPQAREAVEDLIDTEAEGWNDPEERLQIYYAYQDRLR